LTKSLHIPDKGEDTAQKEGSKYLKGGREKPFAGGNKYPDCKPILLYREERRGLIVKWRSTRCSVH